MTQTTITVFSRDKACSDALAILQRAEDTLAAEWRGTDEQDLADHVLFDAMTYLAAQWREFQDARMARMRSEVMPKP